MNTKRQTLGVSQTYKREMYDKPYKRKKVKEAYFTGKKSRADYITSNQLHSSVDAAKHKYGSTHYTKHIADVDHILPEKALYDILKNIPYLSDSDVKEIINIDANYRITSSHLNRKKQSKHNLQVALDKNIDLSFQERSKLVLDQAKATPQVTLKAASLTVKNISGEFLEGATHSLEENAISILEEGITNICLVSSGEKDFKEACYEMGRYSFHIVAKGGLEQVRETGIAILSKNLQTTINSSLVGQTLKSLASSNYVTQILNVSSLVKDSFIKLINGELTGTEFFEEIGEKGVSLISSSIGALAGELLIPIPIVGALVGSFITSTISSFIYKNCIHIYRSLNYHKEKLAEVSAFAHYALDCMQHQREHLHSMIENELNEWTTRIDLGFDQILSSILSDNATGIADGLNTILTLFNEQVKFKNYNEFDAFFMNENCILTL